MNETLNQIKQEYSNNKNDKVTKPSLLSSQNNDSTAKDNAAAKIIDITLTNMN